MVCYLIATASHASYIHSAIQITDHADITPDQLEHILQGLSSQPPFEASLSSALNFEFASIDSMLALAGAGGSGPDTLSNIGAYFLLQENKTKNIYADLYRELKSAIATPPHIKGSNVFPMFEKHGSKRTSALISPNAIGNSLIMMSAMSPERVRNNYLSATAAKRALARAYVALKSYQLRHGELPTTLAELDAQYIDPFSGNSLGYSPKHHTLWSIGDDLIDNKGRTPGVSPQSHKETLDQSHEPHLQLQF